ncbi:hypothetical protein LTR62_005959 [Meristemomyces frigidus]|uniref:Sister chromatid cohesion protein n=1 Tax=Meristemomyces frigidus TaxID=1508187 RepID=A0AAN7TMZ7_9PEZI|nr:hypothetical protein LTR62_005959 [Meristemomyces frigidus]
MDGDRNGHAEGGSLGKNVYGTVLGVKSRLRVPTVHEALPYTPFSSIIPFSPDVIPAPVALPKPSPTYFQELPDVISAQDTIRLLSQGATSAEKASERYQQTVRDVQKLLEPTSLSQFSFKKRPSQSRAQDLSERKVPPPRLSALARMVLDTTDVSYRYLTPDSPGAPAKTERGAESATAKVFLPTPNSGLESTPKGHTDVSTHRDHLPSGSQRSHIVIVPNYLTPAQRAEYQWVPSDKSDSHTPSKAQQSKVAGGQRAVSIDQKQKGELAVQALQTLLADIFEAEDHLQPDTTGLVSSAALSLLTLQETDEGPRFVLEAEGQSRLDSAFQKVVANGRLDAISLQDLTRIQRLCGVAVAVVEMTSLRIGEEWSEQDGEEWGQRLVLAERSMNAARTLLRVMGAGANIKELQSEDCLRSILAAVRTILEDCLVPIAEMRYSSEEKIRGVKGEPQADATFVVARAQRPILHSTLNATSKTLRMLGDFLVKTDVDESSLSVVEAFCTLLIFADNASNERDSIFGVQNVETARRATMDILAKVFAKYAHQRQWIVDSLLTSLDKLPATKQSARQYRLPDAKPIQLVSALLMRLVQTCATYGGEALRGKSKAMDAEGDDENSDLEASEEDESDDDDSEDNKSSPTKVRKPPQNLVSLVKPLHDDAQTYATYIVRSLLNRALASSKSSDEPYRKLLDIFTEDFLNVLGSSDWPAAEMILRALVSLMVNVIEDSKYPVPARTLALEILGTIASGMIELRLVTSRTSRFIESDDPDSSQNLARLVQQLESDDLDTATLAGFEGPYRKVIEYLQARGLDDAQLRSAHGHYLMQWAMLVCGGRDSSVSSDASGSITSCKQLDGVLRNMIMDHNWLEEHHEYARPSTAEGRLAAVVVTLGSKLFRAFNRISNVLLTAMSSEQARVQSRALKSVTMLLEKDPSLLDRNNNVFEHISRCLGNRSPLVRESAVMLIADCVKMRPSLMKSVYSDIICRTQDASTTVRKRATKLLKDFYLATESATMRSAIAEAIIVSISDSEESVAKLARQTIDEIWFAPFLGLQLDGNDSVTVRLRYGAQTSLLIQSVDKSEATANILELLIRQLITEGQESQSHTAVCRNLVRMLADGIVDNSDLPSKPEQPAILQCMDVFARAGPNLFTAAQLERLEQFTKNLVTSDDLESFSAAVSILRHTLPHQSTLKNLFLQNLQQALLRSINKLPKSQLPEVAACLWTITKLEGDTLPLSRLVKSVLKGLYDLRSTQFDTQPKPLMVKAAKLMSIAGNFGKHCDFEDDFGTFADFKEAFPWYQGNTVAGLFVEVVCPYTSPMQPTDLRQASLDALCMVCQAAPRMLLRQDVVTAFDLVFKQKDSNLEGALLTGLDGFFSAGESNQGQTDVPALGGGAVTGTARLGKTYVATDQDGASTSIARRFVPQILRLALSSSPDSTSAFIASKIIVSINRQGLVHPKESGPALVALETCRDPAISNMAYAEHKAQHSKHESLFDKEYMRAVQQAYEYQRDVFHDGLGYVGQPPISKLHLMWEVLKTGKAQVRKKFLGNLAAKLDFEVPTQGTADTLSSHLGFVRFSTGNLALFDYERAEELLQLLAALDKTFAATGSTVAQAIEGEILGHLMDAVAGSEANFDMTSDTVRAELVASAVDPKRLYQLSVAAQICSVIWETRSFIRRVWNLQKYLNKPKNAAKESNRTSSRATNAPALTETYLKRIADLMTTDGTIETYRAICAAFVNELMSVDSEIKVNTEDEEQAMHEHGYDTPSEGTSRKSPSLPPSGGGRKRKSLSAAGTPRKKGRPSIGQT